ncbi:MAG TPA: aspartate/glutamate racemase family protein [Pseudonocardia sp.]|nr:aspartate/glutamate racemase family protein [Pseudonocardia sp.]
MRIHAVTPIHVDGDELARRQARYEALCPAGLHLELHDIGPDAPRALETADEVRESERLVVAALRAAPPAYDVLLPDCILDPGVDRLQGELPVVGILRLSLGWQVLTGRRAGAVARNKAIADELAEKVAAYGWSEQFTGVRVLDLDVHAIADARRWNEAVGGALADLEADGAAAVLNGCSAVEVPRRAGLPVVDPTALALRVLAAGR